MTALCGVCDAPMVTVSHGRARWVISCPAGHLRLPVPSTARGARQYYDSQQEAVEAAYRLHESMANSHKARR